LVIVRSGIVGGSVAFGNRSKGEGKGGIGSGAVAVGMGGESMKKTKEIKGEGQGGLGSGAVSVGMDGAKVGQKRRSRHTGHGVLGPHVTLFDFVVLSKVFFLEDTFMIGGGAPETTKSGEGTKGPTEVGNESNE